MAVAWPEESGCFIENRGHDIRGAIPDIAESMLIPYLLEDKSRPNSSCRVLVSSEKFVISRRVMTLGKFYLTPSHLL